MPVILQPAAAQIFGETHSPAIYKALWLSVPAANLVGSSIVSLGRSSSSYKAATELAAGIDEDTFATTFGAPKTELDALLAHKTVTLEMLLKLSPPGTPDPTPYLYNEAFQYIAGTSALALVCNVTAFNLAIPRKTTVST